MPIVDRPVVLDWTRGRTGPLEPCVFGDGRTTLRSPAKDVPCHKRCAEHWIETHAKDAADRDRLIRENTPKRGK
jgi:hypothetical protein